MSYKTNVICQIKEGVNKCFILRGLYSSLNNNITNIYYDASV